MEKWEVEKVEKRAIEARKFSAVLSDGSTLNFDYSRVDCKALRLLMEYREGSTPPILAHVVQSLQKPRGIYARRRSCSA